jgi:hypothetical protein
MQAGEKRERREREGKCERAPSHSRQADGTVDGNWSEKVL